MCKSRFAELDVATAAASPTADEEELQKVFDVFRAGGKIPAADVPRVARLADRVVAARVRTINDNAAMQYVLLRGYAARQAMSEPVNVPVVACARRTPGTSRAPRSRRVARAACSSSSRLPADDPEPPLERTCEWSDCEAAVASARSDSRYCSAHRDAAKQAAYRMRQAEKRDRGAQRRQLETRQRQQTAEGLRLQIQAAAERRQEIWHDLPSANGTRGALLAELAKLNSSIEAGWSDVRIVRGPIDEPGLTREQQQLESLLSQWDLLNPRVGRSLRSHGARADA